MYDTIDEMARLNAAQGQSWFAKDTLEYFGSKIETDVLYGRYFVSSEKDPMGVVWDGERRYTIRMCDDRGAVHDVGGFGEYDTLPAAVHALQLKIGEGK